MRETVVRVKESKIAEISDVALYKCLKASSEWLRWIAVNLVDQLHVSVEKPPWLNKFNVRLVDASVITEPGSTGSDWRLHYSIELFGLLCDHFQITDPKTGESFTNFIIKKGDLMIGDRGYGSITGINHVIDNNGDFLVRIRNKAFKIMKNESEEFSLLENFRSLDYGEIGDFDLFYYLSKYKMRNLRLCVVKKSPEAAEYSKEAAIRTMKKKQRTVNDETVELYDYFLSSLQLHEMYYQRLKYWQYIVIDGKLN